MEGQSPSEDSFRCETPLGCSARRRVSWVRGLPPSGSSSFALTWPMYKIGSTLPGCPAATCSAASSMPDDSSWLWKDRGRLGTHLVIGVEVVGDRLHNLIWEWCHCWWWVPFKLFLQGTSGKQTSYGRTVSLGLSTHRSTDTMPTHGVNQSAVFHRA